MHINIDHYERTYARRRMIIAACKIMDNADHDIDFDINRYYDMRQAINALAIDYDSIMPVWKAIRRHGYTNYRIIAHAHPDTIDHIWDMIDIGSYRALYW